MNKILKIENLMIPPSSSSSSSLKNEEKNEYKQEVAPVPVQPRIIKHEDEMEDDLEEEEEEKIIDDEHLKVVGKKRKIEEIPQINIIQPKKKKRKIDPKKKEVRRREKDYEDELLSELLETQSKKQIDMPPNQGDLYKEVSVLGFVEKDEESQFSFRPDTQIRSNQNKLLIDEIDIPDRPSQIAKFMQKQFKQHMEKEEEEKRKKEEEKKKEENIKILNGKNVFDLSPSTPTIPPTLMITPISPPPKQENEVFSPESPLITFKIPRIFRNKNSKSKTQENENEMTMPEITEPPIPELTESILETKETIPETKETIPETKETIPETKDTMSTLGEIIEEKEEEKDEIMKEKEEDEEKKRNSSILRDKKTQKIPEASLDFDEIFRLENERKTIEEENPDDPDDDIEEVPFLEKGNALISHSERYLDDENDENPKNIIQSKIQSLDIFSNAFESSSSDSFEEEEDDDETQEEETQDEIRELRKKKHQKFNDNIQITSTKKRKKDLDEGFEINNNHCVFCRKNFENPTEHTLKWLKNHKFTSSKASKLVGIRVGFFRYPTEKLYVFAHKNCLMYTPKIYFDKKKKKFINVVSTINQSRKRRCKECGKTGAMVFCQSCGSPYHFPCCTQNGVIDREKFTFSCLNCLNNL